jgi:hypothetical protein
MIATTMLFWRHDCHNHVVTHHPVRETSGALVNCGPGGARLAGRARLLARKHTERTRDAYHHS